MQTNRHPGRPTGGCEEGRRSHHETARLRSKPAFNADATLVAVAGRPHERVIIVNQPSNSVALSHETAQR
jgi:hypothetical protein